MARPRRERPTSRVGGRSPRFGIDGARNPPRGGEQRPAEQASAEQASADGSEAAAEAPPLAPGDAYRPPSSVGARAGAGADKARRRRRVVPTLTFVLGLALGAAAVVGLVSVGLLGEQPGEAAPAPAPSPTGLTVTVPQSCSEAGALSTRVIGITQEIVVSTRDFDPRRLQDLVDQLQQLDPQIRAATAACNQESRDATIR